MELDELLERLKAAAAKAPPNCASARALAALYRSQCARAALAEYASPWGGWLKR